MYSLQLLLSLLLLSVVGLVDAGPIVNLCFIYFPDASSTDAALHAYFSISTRQSDVDFQFSLLASNGNEQPIDAFRALITSTVDCDVYIGPRTSGYSIVLGPIVTIPWVSDTASSLTLSDKTNFPWFSRMIPNDVVGARGIVAFLEHYNYTTANVICSDEVYGRSLKGGFEGSFKGVIDTSVCISLAASRDEIAATLRSVRASSTSRIIFVATSVAARSTYWKSMVDEINAQGMDKTHIFIFPDAFCQANTLYLDQLVGAICNTAAVNNTAQDAYLAKWNLFNKTKLDFILNDSVYNVIAPTALLNELSPQPRLAVDAVNFVMGAIEEAYRTNTSQSEVFNIKDRLAVLSDIRSSSGAGISGDIALDETGDRIGALLAFYNVQAGGSLVEVARWKDSPVPTAVEVADAEITWLGGTFKSRTGPSEYIAVSGTTEDDSYFQLLLTVVVVGCVFFISISILSITVVYYSWTRNIPMCVFLQSAAVFVTMGMIAFHFVDIATDGVSCYVVVSRDPTAIFSILYIILTLFAFGASSLELVMLLRYFFVVIGVSGDRMKRLAVSAKWEPKIARMSIVSAFIEDIPMVAMASVAVLDESNIFVMASLMISTVFLGSKLAAVGIALSSIISRSSAENALYEQIEEEVRKECIDFDFSRDMDMREVDLPKLQVIRRVFAKKAPSRIRQLNNSIADEMFTQLDRAGVTKSEFIAFVMPRMREIYQVTSGAEE